ncbi:MAG: T9SS type A sorting domain-containing protein [Ferruginibacter sp.]
MKVEFKSKYLLAVLSLNLSFAPVSAQVCTGSWSTNNLLSYDCITGQWIGFGTTLEPVGCPANPVYIPSETTTFTFASPVSAFSINFNAFSTAPGCGKMEIRINDVFYNLSSANLSEVPGCTGGSASFIEVSNGYIIGSPISLSSTNGQGKITITGVNAQTVTISTNDPAGSVISDPYDCINVVPIKLESFRGRAIGCQAILNWETGIESNVKTIELQRSVDAITFYKIAELSPKGSNSKYELQTSNTSQGYFRLKTIDFDGQSEFSNILAVKANCNESIYTLAPNPAHNFISIAGIKKGDKVIVYDLLGRKLLSLNSIENNQIDIHQLPPGTYNLRVITSHELSANLRFIKD